MIVTCDHCGARYKLDESRISGRGAKITCPRCKHVFVVYREQEAELEPQARAVGGDRVASSSGGGGLSTPAGGTATAPLPAEQPVLDPAAIDVHSLEFRKVGIQSWKVKVKIGLVYDFSDFKTLAKYIADGRVTEADLLSHDGQTWTAIGDIAELEQHFVNVYLECEAALKADAEAEQAGGTEDYEDDAPTNIVGMEGLADSIGSDQAASAAPDASARQLAGGGGSGLSAAMDEALRTGGGDQTAAPRFVDPFEARKKGRSSGGASASRAPASAPRAGSTPTRGTARSEEPAKSRAGLWVALLLLVVVAGGGYWWVQQQGSAGAGGAVSAPPQPPPKAKVDGDVEARSVEDDILDGAGKVPVAEQGSDDSRDKPDWDVEERAPCPRGPDGRFYCPDGTILDRTGAAAAGGSTASKATPAVAGGGAPGGAGVEVAPMNARDHASEGDRALGRSDYRTAVAAFRQAIQMEPGNAVYTGKLGIALFRSGDSASAQNYLSKAANGGYSRAYEYLGDISTKQGDSAGAISHYQTYVGSGAPDAARVQQKIDQLSGL